MDEESQESHAMDESVREGDPEARYQERRAHFIRLLLDDDEFTRLKSAEMLGRMEDPEALEDLIGTLWDDDARVRLKAAWALGRIGDMRAYAPLQRLYRMENAGAQEIIQEALEAIRRNNTQ